MVACLAFAVAATFLVAPRAAARPDDDDDDDKDVVKQPAVVQQQVFQEADFDRWIFQNNNDGRAGARKRLEAMLAIHVDDIDRTCKLTDAQKKRVQLAGHGDIKQFFVHMETLRQKFLKVRHDQQKMQEFWQELNPLQVKAQVGIFGEDSFLFRSLHNALTSEQFAVFEANARERRNFRHQTIVESAVAILELNVPLTDSQRRALVAALVKLTPPPRKSVTYGYHVMMYQMSMLPEEKLKPLFDEVQWTAVSPHLNQFKGWKQWLKQSGQLPDEDEAAENNDAKPAAGKS